MKIKNGIFQNNVTSTSYFSGTTYYGDGSNLIGIPGSTDNYVTGGTYSNGTLTLNRQNGSTTVSGFLTGNTLNPNVEINGVTFNGNDNIQTDIWLNIINALGDTGTSKSFHWAGIPLSSNGATMPNQQLVLNAVWVPKDTQISGANFEMIAAGVYTSSTYNGIGLYSYSGGWLTLVASTDNDVDIWKSASNTYHFKPFSSGYTAVAGLYYIGSIWTRSSFTTAPSIMVCGNVTPPTAMVSQNFANSAKLCGSVASTSTFPSTLHMSGVTVSGVNRFWFTLY